jgi:hypothetical protein
MPGWTFNMNSSNSTAPQTEVDVVAKHSYGRQIGRVSDALKLLIEEHHGKAPEDQRFSDFLTMKPEIDNVKQDTAATRIERIVKDLALLKGRVRALARCSARSAQVAPPHSVPSIAERVDEAGRVSSVGQLSDAVRRWQTACAYGMHLGPQAKVVALGLLAILLGHAPWRRSRC